MFFQPAPEKSRDSVYRWRCVNESRKTKKVLKNRKLKQLTQNIRLRATAAMSGQFASRTRRPIPRDFTECQNTAKHAGQMFC